MLDEALCGRDGLTRRNYLDSARQASVAGALEVDGLDPRDPPQPGGPPAPPSASIRRRGAASACSRRPSSRAKSSGMTTAWPSRCSRSSASRSPPPGPAGLSFTDRRGSAGACAGMASRAAEAGV